MSPPATTSESGAAAAHQPDAPAADAGANTAAAPSYDVEFRVRYSETDQMRIAYHANYLVWCEIGRTEFIRHAWASYAELERAGIALAVVEAALRFHSPAKYDDLIRVSTTLRAVKSRTVTFHYVITNAETGQRIATASTTLIALTHAGAVTNLPAELRTALEPLAS